MICRHTALARGDQLHGNLPVVGSGFGRLNSPDRRRKGNDRAVLHGSAGAGSRLGRAGAGSCARGRLTVFNGGGNDVDRAIQLCGIGGARSVRTVPVGASSGTLSQLTTPNGMATAAGRPRTHKRIVSAKCASMSDAKDNTLMGLRGQARRPSRERGYAMAALLVMLAVLTVLMSIAMPVWRHEAQREKEEELVFRGLQYVRAIRLYQAKTRALPAEHRRARAGALSPQEIQGPDHQRRFRPADWRGRRSLPARSDRRGQPNQPGRGGPAGRDDASRVHRRVSRASSVRKAVARKAASLASSARAPRNRFASIRAGPTTTNGRSCSSMRSPAVRADEAVPGGRGVPGGPGGRGRRVVQADADESAEERRDSGRIPAGGSPTPSRATSTAVMVDLP